MRSIHFFAVLLAVSVILAPAAGARQTGVGTTAASNTDTKGTPPRMATRNLFIGTDIFFEERIETSKTGQAQLLFLDESALTIAANSDVVLDKFIYDPKTSKGELALSIGAGLFRYVGGRISKTTAVTIKTPTATIGIRGGIVIIKVEPGTGATGAAFLFGKEMTVTNLSGVTRRVTRPGFGIDVASLVAPPSAPRKVSGDELAGYLGGLEGRTGRFAGLTEPLTGDRVADSGIDQVGSSTDPASIALDTAATGTTDPAPGDPTVGDPTALDDKNDIVERSQDAATDAGVTSIGDGGGTPPTPTLFDSTFAGRVKGTAGGTVGTFDVNPDFNIPFSNARIVDGILNFELNGEAKQIPVTGTPLASAPEGFTGFVASGLLLGDGCGTCPFPVLPFNNVSGFLSLDQEFLFYLAEEPFDPTFDTFSLLFAGVPTPASAFPTSGITAYNLEADFTLKSLIPFIRGDSGGDLENITGFKTVFEVPPAPALIDWGNGVFGGALIAIDGQGFNQTSAASVFGGSVVDGTPATADLVGFMRGTARVFTDEQAHFLYSGIELSRDGDGNAFFGADNPDYFVFQSDGGATEEFAGKTTTYFPNVVTHVDTAETIGTRTTRTLNGFSGGAFELIGDTGVPLVTSLFGNTTGEPGDVNIVTDATNGTIWATIDVTQIDNVTQIGDAKLISEVKLIREVNLISNTKLIEFDEKSDPGRIAAAFGGTGVSAYFDDKSFGALEESPTSAAFSGTEVTNARLYLVTDALASGDFLPAGVDFCQCEFLEWGFWGGDLGLDLEPGSDHVRVHLANWVAGEIPALDMPMEGIATYSGHAIGTVLNNEGEVEAIYQAVGGFSQTYDFATGSGEFSITDFDGADYGGGVGAIPGQENRFTGSGFGNLEAARDISLNGAFYKGGGDPVAAVGGGFNITSGTGYQASGIFAADKTGIVEGAR